MYQKSILNNGLRLITYAMPRMESVAIGIWVRVGGRDESKDIKGVAHFLEHLVFKGSRRYSCRKIKESIEGVGGAMNGFTSEEATCYYAKLPAEKQFQALDILFDMAINPQLNQSDIERERFVILEEIKMYKDLPQSCVQDILEQLLWPGHPLGSPILGNEQTILQLKRQDIAAFQKRCYTPSNIVIAGCGRLGHQEMLKRIKAIAEGLKITAKNTFLSVPDYESTAKLKVLKQKTAQTHLALGFYGIHRDHPDKHTYSLLHVILGGNMSSRLFSEVREKRGLAYQIGTQIKGFADSGMFVVRAGVDNAKVPKAIEVIVGELGRIKRGSVSLNELRRAKEFYIGQLRLALEDTSDHMFWIGEPTLHLNKTYSFSSILREVKKITPDDLRRVARSIFKSPAMRLAVIGPAKQGEKKLYACLGGL
ncbi:MAG: pitrilysin family protein [Candidatus Omnitrophota bacterium]|jgi:predicted Zn-dependent peptidase